MIQMVFINPHIEMSDSGDPFEGSLICVFFFTNSKICIYSDGENLLLSFLNSLLRYGLCLFT